MNGSLTRFSPVFVSFSLSLIFLCHCFILLVSLVSIRLFSVPENGAFVVVRRIFSHWNEIQCFFVFWRDEKQRNVFEINFWDRHVARFFRPVSFFLWRDPRKKRRTWEIGKNRFVSRALSSHPQNLCFSSSPWDLGKLKTFPSSLAIETFRVPEFIGSWRSSYTLLMHFCDKSELLCFMHFSWDEFFLTRWCSEKLSCWIIIIFPVYVQWSSIIDKLKWYFRIDQCSSQLICQ